MAAPFLRRVERVLAMAARSWGMLTVSLYTTLYGPGGRLYQPSWSGSMGVVGAVVRSLLV